MKNELKEARLSNDYTQEQAAGYLGVSLRSYKTYETVEEKRSTQKYEYMCQMLAKKAFVDEEHGILKQSFIVEKVSEICKKHNIRYCYLFGSYAKGKESETSDVDLLVSTDITGLKYYGLVEEFREALCKKVDLLNVDQLINNKELLEEILKDGIRIYG